MTSSTALAVAPTKPQTTAVAITRDIPPPSFLAELGGTPEQWKVMCKQFFPEAKELGTVLLVAQYCKARGLDLMSKPFHVVSISGKDTIWPSITLYEITATRTGQWVGKDEPIFGPVVELDYKKRKYNVPEWCSVSIYRLVAGEPRKFTEKIYYEENVAFKDGQPNHMWEKRPRGQMAKCALAAVLRMAFPEECGNEPTAEEMEGRTSLDLGKSPVKEINERAKAKAQERAAAADDSIDVDYQESSDAESAEDSQEPAAPPEQTVHQAAEALKQHIKETAVDSLEAARDVAIERSNATAAEAIQKDLETIQAQEEKIEMGKLIMAGTRNGMKLNAVKEYLSTTFGREWDVLAKAGTEGAMTIAEYKQAMEYLTTPKS